MNFDVLNQAKTLFDEIADFYANWNDWPENILPDLLGHPLTRKRMDAIQVARDNFKSRWIKEVDFVPAPFANYDRPNPNTKALITKVPARFKLYKEVPPYKLSGQDVYGCVYFARIIPLRDKLLTTISSTLRDVKNDAEVSSRVDWCEELQRVLKALSEQLMTFESTPLSIPNEIEDWPDIDQTLRTLTNNHIKPLIEDYRKTVSGYLPDQEPAIEEQTTLSRRTGRRTIEVNAAPPRQTDLTQKQTVLLMHYLRKGNLVYKDIEAVTLADCFSVLTGFSENTLRPSLSNNEIEDIPKSDFTTLIDHLTQLLARLKDDAEML